MDADWSINLSADVRRVNWARGQEEKVDPEEVDPISAETFFAIVMESSLWSSLGLILASFESWLNYTDRARRFEEAQWVGVLVVALRSLKDDTKALDALMLSKLDHLMPRVVDACRDKALDDLTRLHLLELVEMQSNEWSTNDDTIQYYRQRVAQQKGVDEQRYVDFFLKNCHEKLSNDQVVNKVVKDKCGMEPELDANGNLLSDCTEHSLLLEVDGIPLKLTSMEPALVETVKALIIDRFGPNSVTVDDKGIDVVDNVNTTSRLIEYPRSELMALLSSPSLPSSELLRKLEEIPELKRAGNFNCHAMMDSKNIVEKRTKSLNETKFAQRTLLDVLCPEKPKRTWDETKGEWVEA